MVALEHLPRGNPPKSPVHVTSAYSCIFVELPNQARRRGRGGAGGSARLANRPLTKPLLTYLASSTSVVVFFFSSSVPRVLGQGTNQRFKEKQQTAVGFGNERAGYLPPQLVGIPGAASRWS